MTTLPRSNSRGAAGLALLLTLGVSPVARADDVASGEQLFRVQCAICHSTQTGENMVGPSLSGVYGRAYGAAPGYRYAAAGDQAAMIWDEDALDRYISAPTAVLPQTTMAYPGLRSAALRAKIIAFLRTLR